MAGDDDASRIGIGRELPGWRSGPFPVRPQIGIGQVRDTDQREPRQRNTPAVEGQISICAPAHRHPPPVQHFAEPKRRGLTIDGDGHLLPGQFVQPGRRLDPPHLRRELVIGVIQQRGTDSVLQYPPPQRRKTVVLVAVASDSDRYVPEAVVHRHRHARHFPGAAAGPTDSPYLTLTRPAFYSIQQQLR